ncbi:MAG: efflux RND transporter permease subunit, partial [Rhizobiales bacterium]|nr:efflux RND transporter permease subunit [Hyphomicrobiales bacterium]
EIVPVYDRSQLIERAIGNLKWTLLEESLIVAVVCVIFLLHVRSALVAIITLPLGILIAFIAMRSLGLGSNIMSLGGIAIAIGAMVDAAIVMIENAHKRIEHLPEGATQKERARAIVQACKEVGPALFFSLLIITVSFLPVFALEGQEGRLFSPLAFTKTFAMAGAALLSVTLVPVLMLFFVRGRILPEARNPVNRLLIWLYRPIIKAVLRFKGVTLLLAILAMVATIIPARQIGSEFMPALNEGTLLYMPAALPGMSVTEAGRLLATTNRIIKTFPEVESVYGKAGRASTATDPAPLEMFETIINLKPQDQWRVGLAGAPDRLGIHAEPERRRAPVYADDPARDLSHQGGGTAADAGPHHQVVPGSGVRLRQGRTRPDRDRSGTDGDVRDHHQFEAEERMAAGRHHRQLEGGDGQGTAVPRRLQRLDHADPRPHRHALDRHPHAGGRQGVRHRPHRDGEDRAPDRNGPEDGARHIQRLCRAGDRRLLPRHRAGSRGAWPLRPRRRRRAGRHRDRARRRNRDDDGRGARALRGQYPLPPRPPFQSAGDRHGRSGTAARWWRRSTW